MEGRSLRGPPFSFGSSLFCSHPCEGCCRVRTIPLSVMGRDPRFGPLGRRVHPLEAGLMKKYGTIALLMAVSGLAVAQAPKAASKAGAASPIFGQNLLKNANIEAPIVDPNKVSGWSDAKGLQQAVYGSVSGEWDWGMTGCPGCGKQYLRLDFEGVVHDLTTAQTIDVSAAAEKIDAGKATAHSSAWLGAFHNS